MPELIRQPTAPGKKLKVKMIDEGGMNLTDLLDALRCGGFVNMGLCQRRSLSRRAIWRRSVFGE